MDKSYKFSKYNIDFRTAEGDPCLYNSLTGSLVKLTEEEQAGLQVLMHCNELPSFSPLYEQLIFGGFLTESSFDELDLIRYQMFSSRNNKKSLNLTIAPTLDCNFRCSYCYEKENHKTGSMDSETIAGLMDFVTLYAADCKEIGVTWYGGEPLMTPDVIEIISKELIQFCAEKNIRYSAAMITNGYFLTRKNAELIRNCRISLVQITLDGDKKNHDARRYLVNGMGTYDVILENLKENSEILPRSALRVNIDKSNLSAIKEVADEIETNGLKNKINIYPGRISSVNQCCSASKCLSGEEFSAYEADYFLRQEGGSLKIFPRRIVSSCSADHNYNVVIGPDGSLYKCWNDIGYENRRVGHLKTGIQANQIYLDYVISDPTTDEKCAQCKILPICMGGCPHEYKTERKCSKYKYQIIRILQKFMDDYEREKEDEIYHIPNLNFSPFHTLPAPARDLSTGKLRILL